jgi:hypothetical protein
MKKMILLLLLAIPVYCFSQVTEKKAKVIKETATEIMDALDGINPVTDYKKISDFVTQSLPQAIVKTTLDEYKKNGHFYICFCPNIKSIGVFYIYKEKINLRPIILDPTCQGCIVKSAYTFKEIESKSLVNTFFEKMKNSLTPYFANLIYHPDFVAYMKNNNN